MFKRTKLFCSCVLILTHSLSLSLGGVFISFFPRREVPCQVRTGCSLPVLDLPPPRLCPLYKSLKQKGLMLSTSQQPKRGCAVLCLSHQGEERGGEGTREGRLGSMHNIFFQKLPLFVCLSLRLCVCVCVCMCVLCFSQFFCKYSPFLVVSSSSVPFALTTPHGEGMRGKRTVCCCGQKAKTPRGSSRGL